MRRMVLTNEPMHAFDEDDELADTPEKFDFQVESLLSPGKAISAQFKAESKAFWRALGILCPEARRSSYAAQLDEGQISLPVFAAALQIPVQYVRNYFRDDFDAIMTTVKEGPR